jgi:PAS domain S-box-containing protein
MTEKDTLTDRPGDQNRMPPGTLLLAADEILHMYDSMPFIMCLLDSERRIISGNRQFREVTGWPEAPVFLSDKACGILGCIYSLDDEQGCGFGPHCASCPLRLALLDTFETAARHSDIECRTTLQHKDTRRDVVLLGSTARLEMSAKQMVLLSLVDITERKRAEEVLCEREHLLNEIFAYGGVGVAHWDLDGRLLMLNQRACNNLGGGDLRQYLGKTMIELFGSEAGVAYLERIKMTVKSPEALEFEDRVDLPIGCRWFHSVHTRVRDAEGRVTGVHVYANDITDIKQTEEALHKSKRQYETLVSKITVGIYILRSTPAGTYSLDYVSPRMSELVNCSIESLLADGQSFFAHIHPDDRDGFVALNQEGISLRRPFDWKGRFLSEGTVRWLQVESSPDTQTNGDVLWHGVVTDITERKLMEDRLTGSEKRFHAMFRSHSAVMLLIDPENGMIVDANISAENFYGYPLDELLTMNIRDINSLMSNEISAEIKRAQTGTKNIFEFPHKTARGEIHIVEVHTSPIQLDNSSVLFTIIHDITKRKRAEEEINKKNAEIEQFIYTVSHDLRSPLVTVKTFLGYLQKDMTDGDQERVF